MGSNRTPETAIAVGLAVSTAAQGWLLAMRDPRLGWTWMAGFAAAAAAAGLLWRVRALLNPHVDMILLMGSFGGLGMLLGGWMDGAVPACHRDPWYPLTWMNAGMLLFGFAPSLPWSRCLRGAGKLLIPFLLLDALGMWAGMAMSHTVPRWFGARMIPPGADHVAMTAGMLLGMAATMSFRPLLSRVARLPVALHFSTQRDTLLRNRLR